ncbi:MAG: DUF1295 domain-containing protein [Spirochaetes bacterium]|nr:DUF1295 domain-containing protein [Spirochaetota bacterium]
MKTIQLFIACAVFAFAGLNLASGGSPLAYLAEGEPLFVAAVLCAACALACFILAWITGDYSQTDRLWSLLPPVYVWYFAYRGWPDARLAFMAVLATLWGARLTFNFARKGGYTTEEDYRWIIMREKIPHPAAWQAFNFSFIAGYQHLLVFLISLPAYAVFSAGRSHLGALDYAAAALLLGLLLMETVADEQMWRFQEEKKRRRASGGPLEGDYSRGFITTGLFRFSRHPNYFAEISIWWAFYLFVPAASGTWLHWTIIGAVLLTILFQGSIWLAESITGGKYPEYAKYQARVSRLIPWRAKPEAGADAA